MSCQTSNCSLAQYQPVANSDISGIGVIIGFVATGYLTFFLLIIRYATIPALDIASLSIYPSPLDKMILKSIQSKKWRLSAKLGLSIEKSIQDLSDQQLVTGIAILIVGYTQLGCSLSTYHWQVIVSLAWFSSVTHLSTLTYLRRYIVHKKRALGLRLFLMLCLLVTLFASLLPTGDKDWSNSLHSGIPAICFFRQNGQQYQSSTDDPNHNGSWALLVISEVLLSGGYTIRAIHMFQPSASFMRIWLRDKPGAHCKRGIDYLCKACYEAPPGWKQTLLLLCIALCITLLITARLLYDFFGSILWEIFWLGMSMGWGTIRLLETTGLLKGSARASELKEETVWGFGQLLPVVLLILPFLSVSEVLIHGTSSSSDSEEYDSSIQYSLNEDAPSFQPELILPTQEQISRPEQSNTVRKDNYLIQIYEGDIYQTCFPIDNLLFIAGLAIGIAVYAYRDIGCLDRLIEETFKSLATYVCAINIILLPYLWVIRAMIPDDCSTWGFRMIRFLAGSKFKHRIWRYCWFGFILEERYSLKTFGESIIPCIGLLPLFFLVGWLAWNAGTILHQQQNTAAV